MKSRRKAHLSAVGVWFLFLIVAFALGAAREIFVTPVVGKGVAHVVGTLTSVAVFVGITFFFVWRSRQSCRAGDFWVIGLLWTAMTLGFEFLFFHFVAGRPWEELLADYNVAGGRIWILVPLTTLFGPPAINAILRRAASAGGAQM